MSGFSPAWLALREPADHAARSEAVLAQGLGRVIAVAGGQPIQVVDLATGTGSNVRYLATRLGAPQQWSVVDGDPAVLAALPDHMRAWASRCGWACLSTAHDRLRIEAPSVVDIRMLRADLSQMALPPLDRPPQLVTASALLDLVSEAWVAQVVERCVSARAAVLFALSYDGRIRLTPELPDDALIVELVNAHQRIDKGFGPALGPAAVPATAALFEEAGYVAVRDRSDWLLGPETRRLLDELIAGWAAAARELSPHLAARITAWEETRRQAAVAGALDAVVGHEDLMAWPASA